MKIASLSFILAVLSLAGALAPRSTTKNGKASPLLALKKQAGGLLAAATVASSALLHAPPPADAAPAVPLAISTSTTILAEKEVRMGVYREYEVDVPEQVYDDARSTFKTAKETKSNKGKYTAILAILIVGSFIVPMAQYFWYVRDDDSTDKFFSQQVEVEEPPPKKKGWF